MYWRVIMRDTDGLASKLYVRAESIDEAIEKVKTGYPDRKIEVCDKDDLLIDVL